jgi:hypothetical protein
MLYHKSRPEDLNTELEDHVADEWRYMCMSRPVTPLLPVDDTNKLMIDPLNMTGQRRKHGRI